MCFTVQDAKVSILAESVEKNKRPPDYNNKRANLRGHGFACAW